MTSLFSGPPKPPALPPPPPPPPSPSPMPDPEDVQGQAQRRRKAAEQANRSGRMSTMLSEAAGETLG